ncbi:MAG: GBS Bsp-like repeat-containing protein [Eubacteriales bacterium]
MILKNKKISIKKYLALVLCGAIICTQLDIVAFATENDSEISTITGDYVETEVQGDSQDAGTLESTTNTGDLEEIDELDVVEAIQFGTPTITEVEGTYEFKLTIQNLQDGDEIFASSWNIEEESYDAVSEMYVASEEDIYSEELQLNAETNEVTYVLDIKNFDNQSGEYRTRIEVIGEQSYATYDFSTYELESVDQEDESEDELENISPSLTQATLFSVTAFSSAAVVSTKPVIGTPTVSSGAGKITISVDITSSVGISEVKFPTWSDSNGQDDIQWYTGSKLGDTYTLEIDFKNHNYETGTYTTHIYAYNSDGECTVMGVTGTITANAAPVLGTPTVTTSGGKYTIKVAVSDDYELSSVKFPTWTSANGQDDIIWYEGTVSNGVATLTVDFKDHNYETGTYITHIYAYDSLGKYTVATISATITNDAPVLGTPTVTTSGGKYIIKVPVSDDYGISSIKFPTWTSANGQDDIVWYTGTVSNGIATVEVDFKNHNYETGNYVTHIYVYDGAGKYAVTGASATITNDAPVIGTPTVTTSGGKYSIKVPVSDDYGVSSVMIPTWTLANGQDDIKWYEATVSNGVATVEVDFANHNYETGLYISHIYAYDAAGKYALTAVNGTIYNNAPEIGEPTVTTSGGKYTIQIPVSDDYGISSVMFPTWTLANGQDDIKWYEGTVSNGVATVEVDFANHNYETGLYISHIYVYDASGQYAMTAVNGTIYNEAPTVSNVTITDISASGYIVTCDVSDDYGVSSVLFPTWTSYNGQDDIKWHEGTVSNGQAIVYIKTSDHKYESGTYNTHVYVYDAAGLYVGAATTATVPASTSVPGWSITSTGTKVVYDTNGVSVSGGNLLVMDISKWQAGIDLKTVINSNNVDAVIIRSSYGFTLKDTQFDSYVATLNSMGIPYGIYHYSTATTTAEAQQQMTFALATIKAAGANPTLPVYVDIEEKGGSVDLNAIALTSCQMIEAAGYKAGVYANMNYWNNYLTSSSLNSYYKWIARYGTNNGLPMADWRPDDSYHVWQYTSVGSLSGYSGSLDLNIMFYW